MSLASRFRTAAATAVAAAVDLWTALTNALAPPPADADRRVGRPAPRVVPTAGPWKPVADSCLVPCDADRPGAPPEVAAVLPAELPACVWPAPAAEPVYPATPTVPPVTVAADAVAPLAPPAASDYAPDVTPVAA